MATPGNKTFLQGIPSLGNAFVVIVKTEWNNEITDKLEQGCIEILEQQNIRHKTITVPGAVEIPFLISRHAAGHQEVDAYIALGAVIKGGTPHFEYVSKFVTDGILQLNLTLIAPVIFGVLTLNTMQEALERIGGVHGHKGKEAAVTAIKMIHTQRNSL